MNNLLCIFILQSVNYITVNVNLITCSSCLSEQVAKNGRNIFIVLHGAFKPQHVLGLELLVFQVGVEHLVQHVVVLSIEVSEELGKGAL